MIDTKNLNQAAMLLVLGGHLIKVYDTAPKCGFILEVKPWQIWYEKHIGIVPYRKFCNRRIWLKTKAKERSGRSTDFAGKQDGFLFSDLVRIRTFKDLAKKL